MSIDYQQQKNWILKQFQALSFQCMMTKNSHPTKSSLALCQLIINYAYIDQQIEKGWITRNEKRNKHILRWSLISCLLITNYIPIDH